DAPLPRPRLRARGPGTRARGGAPSRAAAPRALHDGLPLHVRRRRARDPRTAAPAAGDLREDLGDGERAAGGRSVDPPLPPPLLARTRRLARGAALRRRLRDQPVDPRGLAAGRRRRPLRRASRDARAHAHDSRSRDPVRVVLRERAPARPFRKSVIVWARDPGRGTEAAPTVSVVIPVRNGGRSFRHLVRSLVNTRERMPPGDFEVLVIDAGSGVGPPELGEEAGFRVERIPPERSGHGRTRNLGVRLARGAFVCFLTDDVLPVTPDWPLRFVRILSDPRTAGVYGRQVPRDATTMEMYFVSLNYPAEPLRYELRPDGHHPRPGRVVFSNAFSAVRRDVALRIPIPEDADYS